MAAWRRAIELSLGDEDVAKLRSITVANRAGEPGRTGANIAGLSGRIPRFLRSVGRWGCTIRRSSAASRAPWSKVRWLRLTIALVPPGSRRSHLRPGLGWYHWHAVKRGTVVIHTNCGRLGFSPATPREHGPAEGHACLDGDQSVPPALIMCSLDPVELGKPARNLRSGPMPTVIRRRLDPLLKGRQPRASGSSASFRCGRAGRRAPRHHPRCSG
jgi:hypothetical protein